ncbi:hypothetical protein [Rufibacter sp. XAAS-G3-1]|uniref:hypothetical protein n=1 Tax=Rufibacter sp. XAAS-G3-1 TaxID=2729134 RepID=UPI0015E6AAA2|nr:hypothetical protein [Rufibacter sp. XAAS-G3-1]
MATVLLFAIIGNVAGQSLPDSQENKHVVLKLRHNIIGYATYLVSLDSKYVLIDSTAFKSLDKNWIKKAVFKGKKYEEISQEYPDKHLILINIKRKYKEQFYTWLSKQNGEIE